MAGKKINSLSEYIAAVAAIQEDWTSHDTHFVYPWFRGHADAAYPLLPGIYRDGEDDNEENYRHDFIHKGYPFLTDAAFGAPISDWEWYYLMQHYGLPTRLLDWSEGSLIALHFAIASKLPTDKSDACVWLLHPSRFNKIIHQVEQVFIFPKDLAPYLPALWTGKRIPHTPIAIQPVFKSRRITVQKGCFTLHGSDTVPLENIKRTRKCLEKVIISTDAVETLKYELMICGITESSLFPDLPGLSRELKAYYRSVEK